MTVSSTKGCGAEKSTSLVDISTNDSIGGNLPECTDPIVEPVEVPPW